MIVVIILVAACVIVVRIRRKFCKKLTSTLCPCGHTSLTHCRLDSHTFACHCNKCKQENSGVIAIWSQIATLKSSPELVWRRSGRHNVRGYCRHCGRVLVLRYARGVGNTYVSSRTVKPTMDIFCDDTCVPTTTIQMKGNLPWHRQLYNLVDRVE